MNWFIELLKLKFILYIKLLSMPVDEEVGAVTVKLPSDNNIVNKIKRI